MQIDMHFYGVYALARAAGIESEEASIIAHASQFVDDSLDDNEMILDTIGKAVIPILTSHTPLNFQNARPGEQWRVWVPFHFLPGNQPSKGTFVERMTCRQNSEPAKKILDFALDETNLNIRPYVTGVAAHVFADTFSHHGFVGYSSKRNKVKICSTRFKIRPRTTLAGVFIKGCRVLRLRAVNIFAELVPVGHGAVDNFPDLPYLHWGFEFETHASRNERNNREIYLDAARHLFTFFKRYQTESNDDTNGNDQRSWDQIQGEVARLLSVTAIKEKRIKAWQKSIAQGNFCTVSDLDKKVKYLIKEWLPESLIGIDLSKTPLESSHTINFYKAATRYREYIHKVLLPECDLCV